MTRGRRTNLWRPYRPPEPPKTREEYLLDALWRACGSPRKVKKSTRERGFPVCFRQISPAIREVLGATLLDQEIDAALLATPPLVQASIWRGGWGRQDGRLVPGTTLADVARRILAADSAKRLRDV